MKLTTEIFGINLNFIVILIISAVLIIIYDFLLSYTIGKENDPFLTNILPEKEVTGWSVLHFILYFILGYLYPGYEEMFFFTLIGITFEVYEEAKKYIFIQFGRKSDWWKAEKLDVMSNCLGVICGNYVAYLVGRTNR